ncbi:hypothetical protein [Microbispora amethystogenes]|uniref:DUF4240 domain-containing protein n=1 Tax=Microbispora amethystogenes TaxID=1427754 RepID=A0ABQ4FFS5_9ACTN|nr:hypothetical protein [Microbispora amethystogenes]GIH33603.1 hypothetical protein Mam01_37670 [Microbispora amethystogenes]
MTDETFWGFIGALGGVIDEDGADLLGERLTSLKAEAVEAFCLLLAGKVRALTALPLEGRPVRDVGDEGRPPIPLVGDAYENLLYAVVASGRTRYEAVLADPAAVEGEEWEAGQAELLVDVVATALWDVAGLDWAGNFDPMLSCLPDGGRWCETYRGSAWKSAPGAYMKAAHAMDQALNDSAEWRAWWSQTGLRKVEVSVTVNADRSRERVERGKETVRASFDRDRSYFADRDPAPLSLVDEFGEVLPRRRRAGLLHAVGRRRRFGRELTHVPEVCHARSAR